MTSPSPRRKSGEVLTGWWLAFLGVGALAMGLVCWGAYQGMRSEKSLQAVDAEPTLEVSGKGLPTKGPLPKSESESGDTPMLRHWKMLALYSLTVVTLSQPAPVIAGDDKKPLLDRLDKLDQAIGEAFKNIRSDLMLINKEIGSFKDQLGKLQGEVSGLQGDALKTKFVLDGLTGKLDSLDGQVGKLQRDLDALRKRLDSEPSRFTPALDKADLDDLKARLSAIERAILSLQPGTTRTALSPGLEGGKIGRVMLVNNYPEELLFIINSREFRVPAMTAQPVDGVPAGALTYEAISPTWGLRARRTTSLGSGETFTLTAQ